MIELWHRLRQRGYTRRPESLFRVMRRQGLSSAKKQKKKEKVKPYEQMTHPGERVQVDVKVVSQKCIADPELRLFQYTAIDEFTRLRFFAAYPEQSAYSSADFLRKLTVWYARRGIKVECVQMDNVSPAPAQNGSLCSTFTRKSYSVSTVVPLAMALWIVRSAGSISYTTRMSVSAVSFAVQVPPILRTKSQKVGRVENTSSCGNTFIFPRQQKVFPRKNPDGRL